MRIINAEVTAALLPVSACIDVMERAMIAASGGEMIIPPRILFDLVDHRGFLAAMPGSSLEALGSKIVSFLPGNPARGRAALAGFVALFDPDSGAPLAIVDGRVITEVRTAAVSGLAARHLARTGARSCGIIGTGAQADAHIDAMCAVRPVEEVVIWGRSPEKARALAARHAERHGIVARATQDRAEAAACDLVCTATISVEPVLEGDWLQPGAHVSLVGAHDLESRESDTNVILISKCYVDSVESTLKEGGDIMMPIEEGAIDRDHIVGEIGQLLAGAVPGRESEDEITLYNSLGIVAQDLYAALHVMRQAEARGLGEVVKF